MLFDVYCTRPLIEEGRLAGVIKHKLLYDNMTSELFDMDGTKFKFTTTDHICNICNTKNIHSTSEIDPAGKSNNIRVLKIQLGLSCNYSCEYCSQRFVPNAPETNPTNVDRFMISLDNWLHTVPKRIEFWGGEPLVYWKTLKPLSEALREKFPNTNFLMITNGSLLDDEKIEWIDKLDINIGISHDGPGQHVRGPDPLDDPKIKASILKLFKLRPTKVSFNSMIHRDNVSRHKIQNFFKELLGHEDFSIGEGGFIDSYDDGGKSLSLSNEEEHYIYRDLTLREIRENKFNNFNIVEHRIKEWYNSIATERKADTLGQKCGMDKEDTIAVDLRGNVLTCQNVSSVSTAPNGRSHLIGHVTNMKAVKLRTSTHWKFREECMNCPVLQVCKGSCMFLQKELFKISCDNAYSDHIPFFAAAIEMMTGYLPYRIEAQSYELSEERKDLWGQQHKQRIFSRC